MGNSKIHEGHRQRMYERLSQSDALQDHELLEMILFNAIPRKNTNEIAHALLSAFGSLRAVFDAPMEALMSVEGIGESTAAYLRCMSICMKRLASEDIKALNASAPAEIVPKIRERLGGLEKEALEIYCLNSRGQVIYVQRFSSGDAASARVPVEEVGKLLGSMKPAAIILAHNHVSGRAKPSEQDDRCTAIISLLCNLHNVALLDHFILAPRDTYSYYTHGRIQVLRDACTVKHLLDSNPSLWNLEV